MNVMNLSKNNKTYIALYTHLRRAFEQVNKDKINTVGVTCIRKPLCVVTHTYPDRGLTNISFCNNSTAKMLFLHVFVVIKEITLWITRSWHKRKNVVCLIINYNNYFRPSKYANVSPM